MGLYQMKWLRNCSISEYKNKEIDEIKQKFARVIEYSQNISDPKIDDIFYIWFHQKEDYYKAFGNKFIYEVPGKIQFELDDKSKKNKVAEFVYWIKDRWGIDGLDKFISHNLDGFYNNEVIEDYITPRGAKITKGTRLVKAFKFFVDDWRLTEIQNEASRIIQENKIEGHLCFSIHPLDYLSLSETTYNWRSCHSLDGEYRAGNISYMLDRSTVICYLKSDDETTLPNFPPDVPWNSKKWRVLIYNSNDYTMLFAGRQYPFTTATGLDVMLSHYKNLIPPPNSEDFWHIPNNLDWTPWTDYKLTGDFDNFKEHIGVSLYLESRYLPCSTGLMRLNMLVKDADDACQFNDVLHSSCYEGQYTILYAPASLFNNACLLNNLHTKFVIGARVPCLECGENSVERGEGRMVCSNCHYEHDDDNCWYCECCGERLYEDEIFYSDDGNGPYCQTCFNKMFRMCP